MRFLLGNAFSIQMLGGKSYDVRFEKLTSAPYLRSYESYIGHQDLANILDVPCNRGNITLEPGDELVIAQVVGGRLPEGTTVLPQGVKIEFYRVKLIPVKQVTEVIFDDDLEVAGVRNPGYRVVREDGSYVVSQGTTPKYRTDRYNVSSEIEESRNTDHGMSNLRSVDPLPGEEELAEAIARRKAAEAAYQSAVSEMHYSWRDLLSASKEPAIRRLGADRDRRIEAFIAEHGEEVFNQLQEIRTWELTCNEGWPDEDRRSRLNIDWKTAEKLIG